jgi:hypothetical protein
MIKIKPVDGIINSIIGDAQAMKNFHQLSSLLKNFSDYGSIIIRSIFLDDKGITENVRIVTSVLLRRVIEDIDAISVLINKAVSDPCYLYLRRLYENLIHLKFILKEKKESEERAKAYRRNHLLKKRKDAEFYDFSTPSGKNQMEKMKKDGIDEEISISSIDCKYEIDEIDKELQEPQYQNIKNKIDRIKKENKENRIKRKKGEKGGKILGTRWYSLFDGRPTNMELLSKEVDCSGLYFLYCKFSKYTHSENELENINLLKTGQAELIQIRNPMHAQNIVLMALEFGYLSFYTALETLKTTQCLKCFLLFYKENIVPQRAELKNDDIFNLNWETVSDR